jgi:hypothetical protein
VFKKDAGDAKFPRNGGIRGAHSRRDHQNLAAISSRRSGGDEPCAWFIIEIKVQENDIDSGTCENFERLLRRAAFCYSFEFGLRYQQPPQTLPK